MAQVKVQTSAPQAGPGLSSGSPLAAMASPGSLGLQPSVNSTGPSPTPACPAPAAGYGDAPVSATPPGRDGPVPIPGLGELSHTRLCAIQYSVMCWSVYRFTRGEHGKP